MNDPLNQSGRQRETWLRFTKRKGDTLTFIQQKMGKDLADGHILCCRYVHDDSESTEDEVGLKVTDGVNFAEVVLHIQVNPHGEMRSSSAYLSIGAVRYAGVHGKQTCSQNSQIHKSYSGSPSTVLD